MKTSFENEGVQDRPPRMCEFGVWIVLSRKHQGFKRKFCPSLNHRKESKLRVFPWIRVINRDWFHLWPNCMVGQTSTYQTSAPRLLTLWSTFLSSEVPDPYCFSLVQDHTHTWFYLSLECPCLCGFPVDTLLILIFLLLTCLMSIWFSVQLEGPLRALEFSLPDLVKYTPHKIFHLNHFYMYSSVASIMFTLLHNESTPKTFHQLKNRCV